MSGDAVSPGGTFAAANSSPMVIRSKAIFEADVVSAAAANASVMHCELWYNGSTFGQWAMTRVVEKSGRAELGRGPLGGAGCCCEVPPFGAADDGRDRGVVVLEEAHICLGEPERSSALRAAKPEDAPPPAVGRMAEPAAPTGPADDGRSIGGWEAGIDTFGGDPVRGGEPPP